MTIRFRNLAVLLLATFLSASCGRQPELARRRPETSPKSPAPKGKDKAVEQPLTVAATDHARRDRLYAQHCSACHGKNGDGQGLAARFLYPKPRDFRAGRFRLIRSATTRWASQADIEAVLDRGMPGSSMVSWAHLDESDRKLLAEAVLDFRSAGARDLAIRLAREDDDEPVEEDVREFVANVTTPGPPLQVTIEEGDDAASVARGKEVFLTKGCASCHGKEGRGDGQDKMVNSEGIPERPRDLTLGIFKGNDDVVSVYRRIAVGMPGSSMPSSASSLSSEQMADLARFCLSLSDEKARQAVVMRRRQAVAPKVAAVTGDPNDAAWSGIEPVRLTTTPTWWGAGESGDPDLRIQAAHDGSSLAVRLSWADEQPDRKALTTRQFADAAAIELFGGAAGAEPFLGMGAAGSVIDVWMWRADRNGARPEIQSTYPNMVVDQYPFAEAGVASAEYSRPATRTDAQAPFTLPAVASGNQVASRKPGPSVLEATGPGTVSFRIPESQVVKASAQWNEGRWTVVMVRPLQVGADQGVSLKPGDRVSVAFAVWNGSKQDRDGKKRFTIWQDLSLE